MILGEKKKVAKTGTNIQWTDETVNFWVGCNKVSDGCKFCYMHRIIDKDGRNPAEVKRVGDQKFFGALDWEDAKMIFTCSMSDFFIDQADAMRGDAWDVIRNTPQHTWQILTKRPERIAECLPDDWGDGWDNVWLGVSVESQKYLQRADVLRQVPCKTRFISVEPLLAEVDLLAEIDGRRVIDDFHWVIIGGESGYNYGKYRFRPCEEAWISKVIKDIQNDAPHVAVFNKQLGTWLAKQKKCNDWHGGDMNEWPDHLKVREYPFNSRWATRNVSSLSRV